MKERQSPGKRNNTNLFCIQTDQILRIKPERDYFSCAKFCSIRGNKEGFLPLLQHHGGASELEKGAVPPMSTRGQSCRFYRSSSEYNQRGRIPDSSNQPLGISEAGSSQSELPSYSV